MKAIRFAAAAALVVASFAASAAGTQDLTINATVTAVCKFGAQATTPTIDFGQIDPSVAADLQKTTTAINYQCTNGTTAQFSFPPTTGTLKSSGTDTIPYALVFDTGPSTTGTGFGAGSTPKSLSVTAKVNGSDYANASAGGYTDTVTLTLTP